jgi:hypothetical protein
MSAGVRDVLLKDISILRMSVGCGQGKALGEEGEKFFMLSPKEKSPWLMNQGH